MPTPHVSRRRVLTAAVGVTVAFPIGRAFAQAPAGAERVKADVCVYGGTSGGVTAAVALAEMGRSVVLVEPTNHLGGMTSGGLGWIDYKVGEWPVGGLAGKWIKELKARYKTVGIDTNKIGNAGWVVEPHVAESLFDGWVKAAGDRVRVVRGARLASAEREGRRVKSVTFDKAPPDRRGAPSAQATEPGFLTVEAAVFIDCSYEGDLLAAAGVTTRSDREGSAEYGESAAGLRFQKVHEFGENVPVIDAYVRPGDASSGLIPLVSGARLGEVGAPSPVLQAYNFRLCLVTKDPIPVAAPENYDAKRFEVLARLIAAQAATGKPFTPADFHRGPWRLLKISPLPRGKTDVNNAGAVSMDFVGGGAERYAKATWAERGEIWRAHEDYQRGMLYFLRTDERVPAAVRAEVAKWGLPRDEFKDTGGWPSQLYVRECRRMVGQRVMRQADCEKAPATLPDAVGLGVYSLDSHGCQRVAVDGKVVHEGGFMVRIPGPYPIPYGAITPKAEECENVLATFCVSSTHVAFASLRMEPQLMVLSESAAHAAHLAIADGTNVQAVSAEKLRKRLLDAGQVLEARKG
ncbi:MAG TPA: FAD-dependent oxidoreductase [Tepidisphaeraceae bacterium]|nr:FAD-dependent oxidoreductase [Tepidisphaeraceae bacterium]